MFEDFTCECVYVEFSNAAIPKAGRVEYRAKLCDICHARGVLLRADGKTSVAFVPGAPRYQRLH